MAYKEVEHKYSGQVNECVMGTGEKAVTIGGENALPFLSDEQGHAPAVGLTILDIYPEEWEKAVIDAYGEDTVKDPVAWAKHIEANTQAQFIHLRLVSSDPNGDDNTIENCVETAVKVEAATALPLVVGGSGNAEKDGKLLEEVAKALEGKNVVLFSAVEDNYKSIGVAGGMAYGHKVSGESSVDINLAKQLNILLTQLGVKGEDIIMDVGSASAGYGYEYVASTMDRIRLAALGQNDESLQMPIMTNVGDQAWGVREAVVTEEDMPEWGSQLDRGVDMEVATAAACLVSGTNAVMLRHPESVVVMKELIAGLIG